MLHLLLSLLLVCVLPLSTSARQHEPSHLRVLSHYVPNASPERHAGQSSLLSSMNEPDASFRPLDIVHEATHDKYTAFAHPAFKDSAIRVKKHHDLCEPGTR